MRTQDYKIELIVKTDVESNPREWLKNAKKYGGFPFGEALLAGTAPNIASGSTDSALQVGAVTAAGTKRYFVQAKDDNTFHLAETRSATVPIKFSSTGSLTSFTKVAFAEVIRDAPIPVGGALKVISGQKLVLEDTDRLFVWCSSASNVDAICSILEEVS